MDLGFIILRHVRDEITDRYWRLCFNSIKSFYPESKIIMIDDNSDQSKIGEFPHEVTVVQSEFPGRGELLPYYYYSRNKWFDRAVILHDSTILTRYIDFSIKDYKFIWEFQHHWDQIEDETRMIKIFEDEELLKFYQNKNLWKGCFGGMSIIDHSFLNKVNQKYDFSKLVDLVRVRFNRCSFERVIATILTKESEGKDKYSLLGEIHRYCKWELKLSEINGREHAHLPIIKVWTGR